MPLIAYLAFTSSLFYACQHDDRVLLMEMLEVTGLENFSCLLLHMKSLLKTQRFHFLTFLLIPQSLQAWFCGSNVPKSLLLVVIVSGCRLLFHCDVCELFRSELIREYPLQSETP